MSEYWNAKLNPASPRYVIWRTIFDQDEIEIMSPVPVKGKLDGGEEYVYLLDWQNMSLPASDALVNFLTEKFQTTSEIVLRQLDSDGVFPIRKDDVLVSAHFPSFL